MPRPDIEHPFITTPPVEKLLIFFFNARLALKRSKKKEKRKTSYLVVELCQKEGGAKSYHAHV